MFGGGVGGIISIDKFGRTLHASSWGRIIDEAGTSQRAVGLPLTSSGDYDMQGRKLSNVQSPSLENDCVIKAYVDEMFKTNDTEYKRMFDSISRTMRANRNLHYSLKSEVDDLRDKSRKVTSVIETLRDEIDASKKYIDLQVSGNLRPSIEAIEDQILNLKSGVENLRIKSEQVTPEIQTLRDEFDASKKYIDLQVSGNLKPSIEAIEDQILNLKSHWVSDIKNLHAKIDVGDVKITEISNELTDTAAKFTDVINRNYSDVSGDLTQLSDRLTKLGDAIKTEFTNLLNQVKLNKSNIEDVSNLLDPSKTGQIASLIKTVNTDIPLNLNRIRNRLSVIDTLISNIRQSIGAQKSRVDLMDSAIFSRLDILEKKVGLKP
ncbi:uncharacterized protein [Onthophagus taurus]|uniref:uncharacterized protein n=1 Tax=Onthophagus taurus TaxID=166361 RepID=UPI0039BE9A4E